MTIRSKESMSKDFYLWFSFFACPTAVSKKDLNAEILKFAPVCGVPGDPIPRVPPTPALAPFFQCTVQYKR